MDSKDKIDPSIRLWILQLFHHIDVSIPNKESIILLILDSDKTFGTDVANYVTELCHNSAAKFTLAISALVAQKIYSINKSRTDNELLPCYCLISPEVSCHYCCSPLTPVQTRRVRRSCVVYDNENPGYNAYVYRKICKECRTVYLYGEHITKEGVLVDEINRLELPFFKSTDETYF